MMTLSFGDNFPDFASDDRRKKHKETVKRNRLFWDGSDSNNAIRNGP